MRVVRWNSLTPRCFSSSAIAWIGSSFYFIALDLGLRKHVALPPPPPGAHGEEWPPP